MSDTHTGLSLREIALLLFVAADAAFVLGFLFPVLFWLSAVVLVASGIAFLRNMREGNAGRTRDPRTGTPTHRSRK
jgi:hypothetical protein